MITDQTLCLIFIRLLLLHPLLHPLEDVVGDEGKRQIKAAHRDPYQCMTWILHDFGHCHVDRSDQNAQSYQKLFPILHDLLLCYHSTPPSFS